MMNFHFMFRVIFIAIYRYVELLRQGTLALCLQVVYAVANEGSRLDIPEGPLGGLISGSVNQKNSELSKERDLA